MRVLTNLLVLVTMVFAASAATAGVYTGDHSKQKSWRHELKAKLKAAKKAEKIRRKLAEEEEDRKREIAEKEIDRIADEYDRLG